MEHKKVTEGFKQQLQTILLESEQAVYVYLDDIHKFCNEKFSTLLGYSSPEQWSDVKESFPTVFVERDSQGELVAAYQNAMQKKIGAQVDIIWRKKDGEKIPTRVILVPIQYENHIFALHFIDLK